MRETVAERMRTREREYTSTKTFHVQMGTWNVNGKLHGEDLVPWLDNDAGIRPEFVVVAFQESELHPSWSRVAR